MIKYIYILIALCCVCACTCTNYVPIESKHTITYRDTLVKYRDTLFITLPSETVTDTTDKDTSTISTTFAQSIAYVTNGKIYHTLKQSGQMTVDIDTIIKFETKTEVIEKPVIVEKMIPTPYIPTIYKVGLWFSIAVLLVVVLKFYHNLKDGM